MRSRSEELRARNRRVFAFSYLLAALVLVAIFTLSPGIRFELMPKAEISRESGGAVPEHPLFGHVQFGPPRITTSDGALWDEPEGRVLEAGRVADVPEDCWDTFETVVLPVAGRIRLRVSDSGEAGVVEWVEGTGSPCVDDFMEVFAAALDYAWLPSDRFPAPVDLVQPLELIDVAEPF